MAYLPLTRQVPSIQWCCGRMACRRRWITVSPFQAGCDLRCPQLVGMQIHEHLSFILGVNLCRYGVCPSDGLFPRAGSYGGERGGEVSNHVWLLLFQLPTLNHVTLFPRFLVLHAACLLKTTSCADLKRNEVHEMNSANDDHLDHKGRD